MNITGKRAEVVYQTMDTHVATCSNPSECLQLPSEYIPRSEWASILLSSCSNMPSKFSVPAVFIRCRKYKWSILGSSSMKVLFNLRAYPVES